MGLGTVFCDQILSRNNLGEGMFISSPSSKGFNPQLLVLLITVGRENLSVGDAAHPVLERKQRTRKALGTRQDIQMLRPRHPLLLTRLHALRLPPSNNSTPHLGTKHPTPRVAAFVCNICIQTTTFLCRLYKIN